MLTAQRANSILPILHHLSSILQTAVLRFTTLALALLTPLTLAAQQDTASAFFDQADAFFGRVVTSDGLVRYDLAREAGLGDLAETLRALDLAALSERERKAVLVNAYNVYAIKAALEAWPITSPLEDERFFTREAYPLGGQTLSLDQIEKERLYGEFDDARLHFALVCAAASCPPLLSRAYRPERLEEQLEAQTRRSLALPHIARIDGGDLVLSQIFDWYRGDFERDSPDATLVGYVRAYREGVPPSASVHFDDYDWTLNDALRRSDCCGQR
jgi:hypothetical protein